MPRVTNDVACLWHLAHMCTGKGAKELAVNIEDFVIDIYYHFRRSAKRKAQLIKHVSTRCLSLGKCLKEPLNNGTLWNHILFPILTCKMILKLMDRPIEKQD